jgi:hypothetical protein
MKRASTPASARRQVIVLGRATWRMRRGDVLSMALWTRMIIDGIGGAEVRCQESHQDRRPREYICVSWVCKLGCLVGIVSRVVIVSKCLSL